VVAEAEARAGASEADGHLADAAEWLRGALDYAEGEEERGRLAARLAGIEVLLEAAEGVAIAPEDPGLGPILGDEPHIEPPEERGRSLDAAAPGDDGVVDDDEPLPPGETLYRLFVDSLRDDVSPLYRDRPPAFRRALVDLAEPADADLAAAAIDGLAAASPDDPVLRLERARWRLARGDEAAAREDLEAAWEAFGDEPLDLGGNLSVPVMWCEAAMAEGDHAAILERLEARGELTLSHPDLSGFYAAALLAAGERNEARRFLAESLEHFPRRPEIAYLLAGILHRDGDGPAAIALLERSLRVCGAGCSPRELHVPSLRLLAAALAERGGAVGSSAVPSETVERLADVLLLLRGAQGGELSEPGDWMLQARCHELAGESAAAERARARAGAMLAAAAREHAPAATPEPPPEPA
jgi:tetratricopeptide (TPR) repeat protein